MSKQRTYFLATLALASLGLAGCGGGGGGGGSGPAAPAVDPPTGLVYTQAFVVYVVNARITPNAPSLGGGAPDVYEISPALPAGLVLNPDTGVISGTPTASDIARDYMITARNAGGTSMFVVNITVHPAAPTGLAYPDPIVAQEGIALAPVFPILAGGPPALFAVVPALPVGLVLNAATGALSGMPTVPTAAADYTITASNVTGSSVAVVTLEVLATAPCELHYSIENVVYIPGLPIAPNTPTSQCGAVVTYSIVPALPAGLLFSTVTGAISGTPTMVSPEVAHVITAANAVGSVTVTVRIRVSPRYYFTADSGMVEYDLTTGAGAFEEFLSIEEDALNPGFPHSLTGFSMGIRHDPDYLTVMAVAASPVLADMNGGTGPDFLGVSTLPDGFTIGVVFSFLLTDFLSAVGPQHVLTVSYATNPVALAGNPAGAATLLTFADDLGSPPVANIVVGVGEGSKPVLTHGAIQLVPTP